MTQNVASTDKGILLELVDGASLYTARTNFML
jgi:hypothetical protein